jgi:hypothetical protein
VKALLKDLAGARPPTPLYLSEGDGRVPHPFRPPAATIDSKSGAGDEKGIPTLKPKPQN